MHVRTRTLACLAASLIAFAAPARSGAGERLFWGGSIGAGSGDVDYVQVSPTVGVHITPKISAGAAVYYLYRDYADPIDLSTDDYGFDLFGRYRVVPQAFLQLQVSYTDFEYPVAPDATSRDSYSAVLAGGGFVQPMGDRTSFVATVLYDLTYSDDELLPYDDPWVVSVGVAVGF